MLLPRCCSLRRNGGTAGRYFFYSPSPCLVGARRRWKSSPRLSSSGASFLDGSGGGQLRLDEIEERIAELNDGQRVNVNSPKQVSRAIFGDRVQRSTNRTVLQQAANGGFPDLGASQQRIASLVLNHRELSRHATSAAGSAQHHSDTAAAATSVPGSTSENDAEASRSIPVDDDCLSSHERQIDALFSSSPQSKIHPFWREPLSQLTRPSARALVSQLDASLCPMGFDPLAAPRDALKRGCLSGESETQPGDFSSLSKTTSKTAATTAGKKGSFLAYCRDQKEKYPDSIILTRCGDFYECYGVDAIMLVEHCGLNAMAGKAKAGCPIRNVQCTLDCLTEQGFRVVRRICGSGYRRRRSWIGILISYLLSEILSPSVKSFARKFRPSTKKGPIRMRPRLARPGAPNLGSRIGSLRRSYRRRLPLICMISCYLGMPIR